MKKKPYKTFSISLSKFTLLPRVQTTNNYYYANIFKSICPVRNINWIFYDVFPIRIHLSKYDQTNIISIYLFLFFYY